jgi:hypothetical protein
MRGFITFSFSTTDMTKEREREDIWRTVRIEKSVAKAIDDHITKFKRFGAQVYYSRTDFAREACVRLLESEIKIKNNNKEKLEEVVA